MQIFAEYNSHAELLRDFEDNLSRARAFVSGTWDANEGDICELILVHPLSGEWMPLRVEVVYVGPPEEPSLGLEILDWEQDRVKLIGDFVGEPGEPSDTLPLSSLEPALPLSSPEPSDTLPLSSPEPLSSSESILPLSSPASTSSPPPSRKTEPPPKNVQEKVRRLNIRERDQMARSGTLSERVALERAYGVVVWDGLLSNSALTGPEVARIAKNGNATLPHLKVIVGNPSWVAKPEVRRALLTNPRLTERQIERVLRALPPSELKKLPQQTAYAPKVRSVARRLKLT